MHPTLAAVDATIQAAGVALGNRTLLRILTKYWWLTVPGAAALGLQLWQRQKKGDLTFYNGFHDAAPVVVVVTGIITMLELAKTSQAVVGGNPPGNPIPGTVPGTPVKEASFTSNPSTPTPVDDAGAKPAEVVAPGITDNWFNR